MSAAKTIKTSQAVETVESLSDVHKALLNAEDFGDEVNVKIRVMNFKRQTANDRVDEFYPKTIKVIDGSYFVSYKKQQYEIKGVPVNSCDIQNLLAAIYLT